MPSYRPIAGGPSGAPGWARTNRRFHAHTFGGTEMRKIAAILAILATTQLAHGESTAPDVRVLLLTPFVDYAFFEPVKKGMQDAAQAMGVQATFDGTKDGNVKA